MGIHHSEKTFSQNKSNMKTRPVGKQTSCVVTEQPAIWATCSFTSQY